MTNPNLVNTSSVFMSTNIATVTSGSDTIILSNSSGSNNIVRADTLTFCNTTATATSIDAYIVRSSTNYYVSKTVAVPEYSSMVVVDKDYPIYLEEGDTLRVASTGSTVSVVCSFTTITDV